jgi:hypothetical protein
LFPPELAEVDEPESPESFPPLFNVALSGA